MSKVLESLHNDHKNIARLLNLLERCLEEFRAGDSSRLRLMTDILHYMVQYPDIAHHPREDLVTEKLRTREPAASAIADELEAQHERIRQLGAELYDTLYSASRGAMTPRDRIVDQCREYLALNRSHMDIEETEALPRARRALTEDDWAAIESALTPADDPLFGNIVHQSYQELYDQIVGEHD